MLGHERSDSGNGGVLPEALDLAVSLNTVVLQGLHGDGLVDTLDLLGLGVHLLLPLLSSATEAKDEVEGGLLLDVVVRKGAAILKLLSGEDETLLVRGDSLFVLDLLLDVVNGVAGLDIKGDGLSREGLNEDLHILLLEELGGKGVGLDRVVRKTR